MLWCPGIPGSGKTTITSVVVDCLSNIYRHDNVGIAFVYCNYQDQSSQTVTNIIGALLKQFLEKDFEQSGAISNDVLNLYRKHKSRYSHPSLEELTTLLYAQISAYDRTFIVVDALDECPQASGAREMLLDVLRYLRKPEMKSSLFVTSRFHSGIEAEFEGHEKLEIAADSNDVKTYVQFMVQRHHRLTRFVDGNPVLQDMIVQTLTEKAQGMFLLVKLQMESISASATLRQLRNSLNRLPTSFDDLYSEMMHNIQEQGKDDRELAYQILFWISHARRPLKIQELQCALAMEWGSTEFDIDALPDKSFMLDVCGALVTVERSSNIIRLVHYTAQEYFERSKGVHFPKAEGAMALTCLTCLYLDDFRRGPCPDDGELERRVESMPLLEYAAKHWGSHMRPHSSEETINAAMALLSHEKALASAIQIMHASSVRYPNYSQRYPQHVTGLHLAAYFNLEELTAVLLKNGADHEQSNEYYGRPLQAASLGGSENICQLLLISGAKVNALGGRHETALQAAALAGHASVAHFLLKNDADPNATSGRCVTPLQAASFKGYVNIVKMLLEAGAAVNAQFKGGPNALHYAAMHGHAVITETLLKNGANIDSRDGDNGRTALLWAAWNGRSTIVQCLLDSGANIDAVDHQDSTALHLALERHHHPTVQILLDKGAKFDVVNTSNKTQVQLALASIEKINPVEFELDERLSKALELASQAEVKVLRRKAEVQVTQVKDIYCGISSV